MCKDCGCSMGNSALEHTHGGIAHSHKHTSEHSHEHSHPALNEKKTIEVVTKILQENDYEAAHNRAHLDEYGLLCLNLMSSPGAGKTTLLEATIKSSGLRVGVVEGDLETNKDANRIINAGGKAHQISTGQTCHLDAFMVHNGLHHLPLKELDLVFIENVGNLVCPASYDVGAHLNAVLISVPEGSDKVAKYPVMFRAADIVVITKTSLLEYFDFDINEVKKEAKKLNPKVDIIEVDSKTGLGIDKWINYLKMKKELQ
ncbi:hydrogenase nickel incorporation protein HypB [Campylobacter hyointestinalis]|uniref:hydrogenase nickel incorporation protein HypB n=1 Tax=Campylobacter hyointestinalis TaxID=198 RepID=UPI000DCB3C85|nr:hydrogenase nickel incorporation protein HypB [Campylobacter hyointestinalis]RAZ60771.1 hydrogenase accessory protein HypB [Campylobacter hyointestinalis subsp. lawsonii]